MAKEKRNKNITEKQEEKAVKWSQRLGRKYSEKKVEIINKKKNAYLNKEGLKQIWDKIEILWKKLREKETPLKVKIAIFGGFAYMLLPADIIPDIIPGLGFIDDVSVFLYVWKTVIPYLKEVATEMAEEISTEKIKLLLNDTYKGILIRSGIVLLFNILATLVVCFHPFGEEVSNFTASIVFLLCFGYSIYRGLRWIIKNGKVTAKISLSVIKEKSLRKGIAAYVRSADDKMFKQIAQVFKITEAASKISDIDLPSLEDVIHHYVKKFFKSILLFLLCYLIYEILIYLFLKPFLLIHFANLSTGQLLIYPISHVILMLQN